MRARSFPLFAFLNIEEVAVWARTGKEQAARRRSERTRASPSSGLIKTATLLSVCSFFMTDTLE